MPYATRSGATLSYQLEGDGTPPLVFVHGLCGDRTSFAPQVAHFKPTNSVLAMDLRGCGESSAPADGYEISILADDVAWLCSHLSISRPVLVGNSLGGVIVIDIGARYQDLPHAVVALDPAPIDPLPATRQWFEDLFRDLQGPSAEDARRSAFEGMFLPTDDAELRQEIIRRACASPLRPAAQMIGGLLKWNGPTALHECKAPLLIVISEPGGSNDPTRLMPHREGTQFGTTVGAGHFIQLEVPDQVTPMIERFLRNLT